MAKLTQSPASGAQSRSLIWRLYPAVWCLIGLGAGGYILTSETSAKMAAFLASDSAVAERRVADFQSRAVTAARDLERAKLELREERSRTAELKIRIDKLTSDLRAANAASLAGASTPPTAGTQPVPAEVAVAPPVPVVTTTVVTAAPDRAPDTSRLVTLNTPPAAVAAVPDPNAPPVPVRVPQQARLAALGAARSAQIDANATNPISTGSLAPRSAAPAPSADGAPSSSAAPATAWTAAPTPATSVQAPPTVTANASSAALRLATAPSLTSLRQSWAVLVDRHPEILQGLSPRYRDATSATGRSFQLIAGPLLSRGEAIQLCAMLQVQAVNCGVDTFAGEAL